MTNDIWQQHTLEVAPYPFRRIEVGRITGQHHQLDALGSICPSFCKKLPHCLSSMDRCSVPHDAHKPSNLLKQVLQEPNNTGAIKSLLLLQQVQLPIFTNAANNGQMVSALPTYPLPKKRPLPNRRPGSHYRRQQVEATLVHKQDSAILFYPLFFRAGHLSSFHSLTASWSCWTATRTGFCTDQPRSPMLCRIRATCERWYFTPNIRSITTPTRLQVHTSPAKPKEGAPCLSRSGNWSSCWGASFGLAPLGGLRYKPSTPPACSTRRSHWLTAPCVTPKASAIRFCVQPCSCSSQARSRRPSNQSVAPLDNFCVGSSIPTSLPDISCQSEGL